MRLILFAGKGGTGKTSMASATGVLSAKSGLRTMVMSLDPAHSLSDAFDLDASLVNQGGGPVAVAENLWIQEINVNQALDYYWEEVHDYLSLLFNTTGLDEVVSEEIAILPGMEEISALLFINQYVKEDAYDVLLLDCAPTAESIRFVSMPTALDWYMKKVFKMERNLFRITRPIAQRFMDVPLPDDNYFASIERLHKGLEGVHKVLSDPDRTTVRLVSLAEKMVLKETQRALMYFSLHGMAVEAVIVNRLREDGGDLQDAYLQMAAGFFDPLPLLKTSLQGYEVLGMDNLVKLGGELYQGRDPLDRMHAQRPLQFIKAEGKRQVKIHLPFAGKGDIELLKVGDELVILVGGARKIIALPHGFVRTEPVKASFEGDFLVIDLAEEGREKDDPGQ